MQLTLPVTTTRQLVYFGPLVTQHKDESGVMSRPVRIVKSGSNPGPFIEDMGFRYVSRFRGLYVLYDFFARGFPPSQLISRPVRPCPHCSLHYQPASSLNYCSSDPITAIAFVQILPRDCKARPTVLFGG